MRSWVFFHLLFVSFAILKEKMVPVSTFSTNSTLYVFPFLTITIHLTGISREFLACDNEPSIKNGVSQQPGNFTLQMNTSHAPLHMRCSIVYTTS